MLPSPRRDLRAGRRELASAAAGPRRNMSGFFPRDYERGFREPLPLQRRLFRLALKAGTHRATLAIDG
ncbi:hypothetical protein OIV42_32605, partial [Burkholderia pseudomallei]|nr:hypothetical protein [Burkholderia pseudomallei]